MERKQQAQQAQQAQQTPPPPADVEIKREISDAVDLDAEAWERVLEGLGVGQAHFGTYNDGRTSKAWPSVAQARDLMERKY